MADNSIINNSIINKSTMVQYMMVSNRVIDECMKSNDINFKKALEELKPSMVTLKTNIEDYKKAINNPNNPNINEHKIDTLYLIIQICLDKKYEYTPYKKNVIHNIVFNILKKANINSGETFFICGIILKIINIEKLKKNLSLSHLDTLIYILDKLFMYKFPTLPNGLEYEENNGSGVKTKKKINYTSANYSKNKYSDGLPSIYNRYKIYSQLGEINDASFKKYLSYYTKIKNNNNLKAKKKS
jgi:hypothetical protein